MKKSLLPLAVFVAAGVIAILFNIFFITEGNENMSEWKQTVKNEPGIVIDVRTPIEYEQGYLAATDLHYDFNSGEFEEKVDQLDKDKTYYLYCRTGNRSGKAAEIMKDRGFKNVHNIGGYEDLANEGFEIK